MQDKFSHYANKFPVWAAQSDGMAQHITWTALEAEGLGANLQHYNPLIDASVQKTWDIPEDWELSAQLVFGTPAESPGEKQFIELSKRLKVYGAWIKHGLQTARIGGSTCIDCMSSVLFLSS